MTASASRSSRTSASEERGEREDKRGKRSAGQGGMSTGMMIGIGVGVLVLLAGGIALSGGGKKEDAKKPADTLKDEDEKTEASVLEQLAERALANNERSAAVNYYTRAANKAEREGNSTQARRYNMKAMDLIKTSTRGDR
ncbi:MAG: hypothetical protein NTW87_08410 [Planctomycetota bacterium]|nr:hypothetical protein [Planctomycetota bacterium]